MITSYTCNDSSGNPVTVGNHPYFTYTGQCEVIDDGDGNWRIRFLTDGDFESNLNIPIDAFLVGGGGGYTTTQKNSSVIANTQYVITVGAGGESDTNGADSSAFNIIATGGIAGTIKGGSGGSGGGTGGSNGGSDGSAGFGNDAGTGQGTTTREFGQSSAILYSGGGGAHGKSGGSGIVVIRNKR